MGQHDATKNKFTGAVAVSALIAGAVAIPGLGSAPTANATCASFFGIGNSAQCTSNLSSVAIALGTNATAHADGYFSIAFAAGELATTSTSTSDLFNFATAVGYLASAHTNGVIGIATQLGPYGQAATAGVFSVALNVTTPGTTKPQGALVTAGSSAYGGVGNVAVNLFGNGTSTAGHIVDATGNFGTAVNLGGNDNLVRAGFPGDGTGNLTQAVNLFGSDNTVTAGPGPLAIAGSVLQSNATTSKSDPGFNINGLAVGGAAAVDNAEPVTSDSVAPPPTTATEESAVSADAGGPTGVSKPATPLLDVADKLADKAPVASTAIEKTVALNAVRKAERKKVLAATSDAIQGVVDSATDGKRNTKVGDAVKDGRAKVRDALKPVRDAMKDRRAAIKDRISERVGRGDDNSRGNDKSGSND